MTIITAQCNGHLPVLQPTWCHRSGVIHLLERSVRYHATLKVTIHRSHATCFPACSSWKQKNVPL